MKEFNVNGTLLSINEKELELKNEKKTKYHLASFSVIANGQKRIATAMVWGSIKSRLSVGEVYTLNGRIMENGRVLFQAAPFAGGEVLTAADFGAVATTAKQGATV